MLKPNPKKTIKDYNKPTWYVVIDGKIKEQESVVKQLHSGIKKQSISCREMYTSPKEDDDIDIVRFDAIFFDNMRSDNILELEITKQYILYVCQKSNNSNQTEGKLKITLRANNQFKDLPIEKYYGKEHYFESLIELSRPPSDDIKPDHSRENQQYYKLQQLANSLGMIAVAIHVEDNFEDEFVEFLKQVL